MYALQCTIIYVIECIKVYRHNNAISGFICSVVIWVSVFEFNAVQSSYSIDFFLILYKKCKCQFLIRVICYTKVCNL